MDQKEPEFPSSFSFSLFDLLSAGNLDRVVAEGRRFLGEDPEDKTAHYCLALALIERKRLAEAERHVDFLLQSYPGESNSHLAAIALAKKTQDWNRVRKHALEGIGIEPETSLFHFYAACSALFFLLGIPIDQGFTVLGIIVGFHFAVVTIQCLLNSFARAVARKKFNPSNDW